MAYQSTAITAITDIPALVNSFATTLGWTVAGGTIKHPTYTGARAFTVNTNISGTHPARRERVQVTSDAPGSQVAWAESPKLNPTNGDTDGSVVQVQPTRLHLIGQLGGSSSDPGISFIAGVIEYGFNLYRHFYLGYMQRITNYPGGEVHTGSAFWPMPRTAGVTTVSTAAFDAASFAVYPFSGNNAASATDLMNGGVYIPHAGNPTPFRKFFVNPSTSASDFNSYFATEGNNCVIGGFKDSMNSGYLCSAKSPYAGTAILTPINLYIGKRVGTDQFFQPIGIPAGARLISMEDVEPGAQITIGTSTWRVFPVFSKSDSYQSQIGPGVNTARRFPMDNTSAMVGMAYQVSP